MMNKFESRLFIAIIGEVYCLVWKGSQFYFSEQSKFLSFCNINNKTNMFLHFALSAVNADKLF